MVNVCMVKSNFYHGQIYNIFIRAWRIQGVQGDPGYAGRHGESRVRGENPGCAGRIQGVRGENPGCAGSIQGARWESRVSGEDPGCAGRIQGARGEFRVHGENQSGSENPGCGGEFRVRGDNPGCTGRIRVHGDNPGCAGSIQCPHGISRVHGEYPGCAGRIQGAQLYSVSTQFPLFLLSRHACVATCTNVYIREHPLASRSLDRCPM
jgi:hypothetical protein